MAAIKHICLLLFIILAAANPTLSKNNEKDLFKSDIINYLHPDADLNVKEIIQKYGYPVEAHEVVTKDGYILEMHRIPHGLTNLNPDPNRPVVLLMHGLLCSSADWVVTGTDKGLAFILADLGYDVWMGNARGNTWSRKHRDYDPNKFLSKFWDFSWHEIGIYDLPAMIDHITETTKTERIFYVAHSQGATAFYVMTSEKPEYNDKIRLMVGVGPAAYMGHMPNFFMRIIAKLEETIDIFLDIIGSNEFLPNNKFFDLLGKTVCEENSPIQGICSNVLFLVSGYNPKQLNDTVLPIILTHTPAGASSKQIRHFSQGINSNKFRQFDYGFIGNLKRYNKLTPPNYNLSKVAAPVALFYSSGDKLVAVKDVNTLAQKLPNLVYKHRIEDDQFSHLDFLWANEVVPLLYSKIIQLLQQY